MAFATLHAVGLALGADVELLVRWHGEALDRLLDEAHAAVVDAVVRMFRDAGWEVAIEASFAVGGERGSIDVFAWHPATEIVAVVEVKSVIPDSQATLFGLDRKVRVAPIVARERGWTCRGVARVLVVGEGRTSRRRVERHSETFEAALPTRGRAFARWLVAPTLPPPAALVFVPTAGQRWPSSPARQVGARRGPRAARERGTP